MHGYAQRGYAMALTEQRHGEPRFLHGHDGASALIQVRPRLQTHKPRRPWPIAQITLHSCDALGVRRSNQEVHHHLYLALKDAPTNFLRQKKWRTPAELRAAKARTSIRSPKHLGGPAERENPLSRTLVTTVLRIDGGHQGIRCQAATESLELGRTGRPKSQTS